MAKTSTSIAPPTITGAPSDQLSTNQWEWLEFAVVNRRRIEGAVARRFPTTPRPSVEDAVSGAIAELAGAFKRHPDWPDTKFRSRQHLIPYVTAASTYHLQRTWRTNQSKERLEFEGEFESIASPPTYDMSIEGARRLREEIGDENLVLLRALFEGWDLRSTLEMLPELELATLIDRLLLLHAQYPWLHLEIPPLDHDLLPVVESLVEQRVPTLNETDTKLVAARLMGFSYEEIAVRLNLASPNTLRQRIHRARKLGSAWLDDRLPDRTSHVAGENAV